MGSRFLLTRLPQILLALQPISGFSAPFFPASSFGGTSRARSIHIHSPHMKGLRMVPLNSDDHDVILSQEADLPEDMLLGENFRPAFETTRSACLDLFSQVVPGISRPRLHELLSAAWQEDPDTTVKLIFHIGNIREGGKQDRDNYYRALVWLHDEHPKTFLLNAPEIPNHSCLKCLLNILMFITHPTHPRYSLEGSMQMRKDHEMAKNRRRHDRDEVKKMIRNAFAVSLGFRDVSEIRVLRTDPPHPDHWIGYRENTPRHLWPFREFLKATTWASSGICSAWNDFINRRDGARAEKAKGTRRELQAQIDADVRTRLQDCTQNSSAKVLFDLVTDMFVEGLSKEIAVTARGVKSLGGLFAKWAPTPKGMHDKATRISEAIAKKLYDRGLLGTGLPNSSDVANLMLAQRFARDVLTPLRAKAKVPEHFVGIGAWNEIDYDRMASRCRLLWGEKVFQKHDRERYDAYLEDCKDAALSGDPNPRKRTVKTGALLPDEVLDEANEACSDATAMQANLQWRGIVEKCLASAAGQKLKMVPICDVSGSMMGRPMQVAVALSLLLCESAPRESPWHGKLITFSASPRLVEVPGIPIYEKPAAAELGENKSIATTANASESDVGLGDLSARAEFVKGLEWGMNTNLDKAMDLLLEHMIRSGTTAEEARQLAIVIFSDMEFDQACDQPWETAHQSVARKFQDAGYGPTPPLVVYWNLRGSRSIPVQKGQCGTVLLSGYSAGMMRAFLEGNLEEITPIRQMERMLFKPIYRRLQVAPEDMKKG